MNGNVNGNGVLRKWHIYAGLFSIILACAKVVFFAGGTEAKTEEQIANLQAQVTKIEREYARADVINEKLASIEQSQKREEQVEIDLAKTLEDIRNQLSRRR